MIGELARGCNLGPLQAKVDERTRYDDQQVENALTGFGKRRRQIFYGLFERVVASVVDSDVPTHAHITVVTRWRSVKCLRPPPPVKAFRRTSNR